MEVSSFLSAEHIVSHNVRFENVILIYCFVDLMQTVQKSSPFIHKVTLHYRIIPPCNIWHTFAVSGVVKQLETLKTFFCFSAREVHIFLKHLRYSTLVTRGIKK
jgi:hypothetical protein